MDLKPTIILILICFFLNTLYIDAFKHCFLSFYISAASDVSLPLITKEDSPVVNLTKQPSLTALFESSSKKVFLINKITTAIVQLNHENHSVFY